MRFLVHGSFLMPGNKVLQAGPYTVELSDPEYGCIAKAEAEMSVPSILMCVLLSNGFS